MAQNTLEIIIKANSSKAVSEIQKLDTAIGKTSSASAKGFDAIKAKWNALDAKLSSPGGWKIMTAAAGTAVGMLTTVGITVKKLADDFMDYAFQVEDFGRKIGATPEEASKLIQVADDVRLSVESMAVAMRTAISKGYNPSIEGLKKLSDEYLAIQNPIERTRFAMEIFGTRAGPEMAKLLELGSKKIEEMGDSVEGTGRLMTSKGIKAAIDYYNAMDNLGDKITDITLLLGGELAPAITKVADGFMNTIDDGLKVVEMFVTMQKAMEKNVLTLPEAINLLDEYLLTEKTGEQIIMDLTTAMIAQYNAVWYASQRGQEMMQGFIDVGGVMDRTKYQFDESAAAAAKLGESVDKLGGLADKSASDMARLAEQTKIKDVEIGLEFKVPDFASQMKNLMDSIDWKAAGGAALETFMLGFSERTAPLSDEQKKAIAAQVGAVDVALRVDTGEITKTEGITEIKDLFKEIGGIDTASAQALIDKISAMSPPEISDFLNNIVQLGTEGVTGIATEKVKTLNESTAILNETIGKSIEPMTNWKDIIGQLKDNAKYGAENTKSMNEEIAKLPKKVRIEFDIIVNGAIPGIPKEGTTLVTTTSGTPAIKQAASGLDMIVPPGYSKDTYPIYAKSGERILVQTPAQRANEKDHTVNINNVFNIAANAPINVRELARQVVREQQRAGVT